jgi:hypothetical protein
VNQGNKIRQEKGVLAMKNESLKGEVMKNCMNVVRDTSLSPEARAEFLFTSAGELGFHPTAVVTNVLRRLDKLEAAEKEVASLRAKVAEAEAKKPGPLQPEIFLQEIDGGPGRSAVVLSQGGPVVCAVAEDIAGLVRGNYVLIDRASGQVVRRDGAIVPTGEIARLEKVPAAADGLAVLNLRDQRCTAYVSEAAWRSGELRPGRECVFDPARHIVHAVLPEELDGSDILMPAAELSRFTLESLGAPHPVIWRILRIIKCAVDHPDWEKRLRARDRRSFLFWGPTGTGKTATIKVICNLVADWIEELTGVREPLLATVDASTFYSPYLGVSEERINLWFRKLGAVARREVVTRDGRRVRPGVICLLEEVENLVRQRGEHGGSSHLFDRLLALILMRMDSISRELDVPCIFIATTNRKDLLDAAGRRRFGEREVRFSNLSAGAALAVLEKKVPADMEIDVAPGADRAAARSALIASVLHFLSGDGEEQAIAEATLRDSRRVPILKRQLVTGSMLESAVSRAVDAALDASAERGELVGISPGSIIEALDDQFQAIATSLRAHNVLDYAPDVFDEEGQVASVRPLRRHRRRPAAAFVHQAAG